MRLPLRWYFRSASLALKQSRLWRRQTIASRGRLTGFSATSRSWWNLMSRLPPLHQLLLSSETGQKTTSWWHSSPILVLPQWWVTMFVTSCTTTAGFSTMMRKFPFLKIHQRSLATCTSISGLTNFHCCVLILNKIDTLLIFCVWNYIASVWPFHCTHISIDLLIEAVISYWHKGNDTFFLWKCC